MPELKTLIQTEPAKISTDTVAMKTELTTVATELLETVSGGCPEGHHASVVCRDNYR